MHAPYILVPATGKGIAIFWVNEPKKKQRFPGSSSKIKSIRDLFSVLGVFPNKGQKIQNWMQSTKKNNAFSQSSCIRQRFINQRCTRIEITEAWSTASWAAEETGRKVFFSSSWVKFCSSEARASNPAMWSAMWLNYVKLNMPCTSMHATHGVSRTHVYMYI